MNDWKNNDKLNDIYHDAVNGRIPLIGNQCPICSKGTLHIYAHVFQRDYEHAGGWIWCDNCHSYDHCRSQVPKWWADIDPLDIKPLDIPPKHLSTYVNEIDERNENIHISLLNH
ncbi:MAG: hypothetical protein II969_04575 [Anaerolineaceae bacterium]|nr:hypothetical protein [Anaerolineaceae bacterium]